MNPLQLLAVLLRPAEGGGATVSQLATSVGGDEAAVRRAIQQLEDKGCEIACDASGRHILQRSGLGVWADYLETLGDRQRRVEVYRTTGSTQDAAKRLGLAQGGSAHRAVVAAGQQTAGRGRLGRTWHAPGDTALTFSYIHVHRGGRGGQRTDDVERLTFASSVAVAESLAGLLDHAMTSVTIKWPNDVYADGKKIAGILVENEGPFAVIGVGVNISLQLSMMPEDIRQRATSLALCGLAVDRLAVLGRLVTAMDRAFGTASDDSLLSAWRRRCGMLHQHVRLMQNGQLIEGQVIDLDPREGLIVRRHSGELVHLHAGTTTVA